MLEKNAQVEDLRTRLEEMRTSVVEARAQVQTANGRAEAASGMAEAELALQSLKSVAPRQYPDAQEAARLLRQSGDAFDKENYGGALYLAGQAKGLAVAGRSRLTAASRRSAPRTGETPFAVPVRLNVTVAGSARNGPGTDFPVVFPVAVGEALTGLSYVAEWIKVSNDQKRLGWINRTLVGRR